MPLRQIETTEMWCDDCGCDETFSTPNCSMSRSREMARERGWLVDIYEDKIYCPKCKERHGG